MSVSSEFADGTTPTLTFMRALQLLRQPFCCVERRASADDVTQFVITLVPWRDRRSLMLSVVSSAMTVYSEELLFSDLHQTRALLGLAALPWQRFFSLFELAFASPSAVRVSPVPDRTDALTVGILLSPPLAGDDLPPVEVEFRVYKRVGAGRLTVLSVFDIFLLPLASAVSNGGFAADYVRKPFRFGPSGGSSRSVRRAASGGEKRPSASPREGGATR